MRLSGKFFDSNIVRRVASLVAVGVLPVLLMAGCGGKSSIPDYKSLYAEAMEKEFEMASPECQYKLIYINDDEVPELYYAGSCEAEGSGVFYIDPSGQVQLVMMGRIAGSYEPRANFYYHCQGHMGYYYDEFYGFVDGDFVYLEGGNYEEIYDETVLDQEGNPGDMVVSKAYYNGEEVTEEEYFGHVEEMLEGHEMIDLQEWFFTKDGKTISDDEYWDHFGEEGYQGGPDLMNYEELMEALGQNK